MGKPVVLKVGGDGTSTKANIDALITVTESLMQEGRAPIIVGSAWKSSAFKTTDLLYNQIFNKERLHELFGASMRDRAVQAMQELGVENQELLQSIDLLIDELTHNLFRISEHNAGDISTRILASKNVIGEAHPFADVVRFKELERQIVTVGEKVTLTIIEAYMLARNLPVSFTTGEYLGIRYTGKLNGIVDVPGFSYEVGDKLSRFIQQGRIPLVTGFDLTNGVFDRSGSDRTAAILAECIDAEQLVLLKSTAGVLNADPAIVGEENARNVPRITYREATQAGNILYSALQHIERKNIPLVITHIQHAFEEGFTTNVDAQGAGDGVKIYNVLAHINGRQVEYFDIAGIEERAGAEEHILDFLRRRGIVKLRGLDDDNSVSYLVQGRKQNLAAAEQDLISAGYHIRREPAFASIIVGEGIRVRDVAKLIELHHGLGESLLISGLKDRGSSAYVVLKDTGAIDRKEIGRRVYNVFFAKNI